MGNRNKKSRCLVPISVGSANKNRRNNKKQKASSSTHKRRRPQNVKYFELKDMKKLESNDEAFHLSLMKISDIMDIIRSRKTPTWETYMRWDKYAISFYLKMCICFGVDYQHLEATSKDDDENGKKHTTKEMSLKEEQEEEHMECSGMNQPSIKEMSDKKLGKLHLEDTSKEDYDENGKKPLMPLKEQEAEHMECIGVNQPSTKEMSDEELNEEQVIALRKREKVCCRMTLTGPFKFGSYSSGTTPDRIPYNLYLLVKEAVDIIERHNNTKDLIDLTTVEKKIRFFCNYFYSHLPTGWNYNRNNARSLIAGYDTTSKLRDLTVGYIPIPVDEQLEAIDYEEESGLSPQEMVDVMSIIHSRKTPTLCNLSGPLMSFYCKLCSCFGIDYHCLEAASEDDVCLMNMGRKPRFYLFYDDISE